MSTDSQKYKSLLKDTLIFAFGSFGSKIILFLLVPIYTNYLTSDQYGIAELIITIGQLVLPVISLTIFDALLRFGLMKDGSKEDALLVATVVFIFGCLITIALSPLCSVYKPISEWRWYLCGYVLTSFFLNNCLIYLKVIDKNRLYALLSILQAFLLASSNVLFLIVLKSGIKGYLISTVISTAITAVLAFLLGHMFNDLKKARFNKKLFKNMVSFSAPLIVNNISWWLIHSSDKIMIQFFLSAGALGIYTAASKIPSLLNVVTTIFNQAWGLSSIREFESTNDSDYYGNVFRYFLFVIVLICIIIIVFTKPFMAIYVGSEFISAWHYVPILLMTAVFSGISSFCGSLYSAVKQSKNVMITTIVSGLVNVLVNYLLIPRIGIYGAAIGSLMAYITICVLRVIDLKRYISFDFSIKIFVLASLILGCQVVAVTLNWHLYLSSIIVLVTYLIIFRKDIYNLLLTVKHIISKRHNT